MTTSIVKCTTSHSTRRGARTSPALPGLPTFAVAGWDQWHCCALHVVATLETDGHARR